MTPPRDPHPVTPLPELPPSGGILLVGGTFDPPHLAHVRLAEMARLRVDPEAWLYFVPAARSPHKDTGPDAGNADRVRMLTLAIAEVPSVGVWTDEIDRAESGEPSYWVRTLERARGLIGADRELRFLIGADQAVSFHRWKEPERILALAVPVVINRGEVQTRGDLDDALEGTPFRETLTEAWCDVPKLDISATDVREALAHPETQDLRGLLDPRVSAYITERGLYEGDN